MDKEKVFYISICVYYHVKSITNLKNTLKDTFY